ncbi:MAG: MBL fold metallo-hydrolase [Lachnospirales bacterium]
MKEISLLEKRILQGDYLRFCPLSSSSKGNCIFIRYNNTRILVDAGISCKKIKDRLEEIDESIDDIDAIFITHCHSDHICGIDVLYRKHNIPIFATEKTWQYIQRHNKIKNLRDKDIRYIYPSESLSINDVILKSFSVPHDAVCTVGYTFYLKGYDGYKVSIATDLGYASEEVIENISNSNLLFIECNYDREMLKNGNYPYHLKNRIIGKRGHLSNECAGNLIANIYHKGLNYIYLGHMSEENNLPMLAYDTVTRILHKNNIKVTEEVEVILADRRFISKSIEVAI